MRLLFIGRVFIAAVLLSGVFVVASKRDDSEYEELRQAILAQTTRVGGSPSTPVASPVPDGLSTDELDATIEQFLAAVDGESPVVPLEDLPPDQSDEVVARLIDEVAIVEGDGGGIPAPEFWDLTNLGVDDSGSASEGDAREEG